MPRTFNGTSDAITLGISSVPLGGPVTVAAILRRSADGNVDQIFYAGAATSGTPRWQFQLNSDNTVRFVTAANTFIASTTTVLTANGWYVVAASKANGTTTPRFHIYRYGTNAWAHENGGATNTNGTAPVTSCTIGKSSSGTNFFHGDIEMVGCWASVLADQQVEGLAHGIGAWFQAAPAAIWRLDQSATTLKVLDITGNHADESSLSGTTVGTTSSPFNYGIGPRT